MTNAKFEELAEKFYRETGLFAPGKSEPPTYSGQPYKLRCEAWVQWLKDRARRDLRDTRHE